MRPPRRHGRGCCTAQKSPNARATNRENTSCNARRDPDLPLGLPRESIVRHLGIEVDDAIEITEKIDI